MNPTEISAADLATAALLDLVSATDVGDAIRVADGGDGVSVHYFGCALKGYVGWHWAVSIAQVDGFEPTVDEVVLLPGEDAIVAPSWVPYRERIKPGDLSPGDILPTDEDDIRLVPGQFAGGDESIDGQAVKLLSEELGLDRARVLSIEGRHQAAQRWALGVGGPEAPLAQQTAHKCRGCGFLMLLAGELSNSFGVCANEYANDDGRVVAFNHGCGAHSEAQLRKKQLPPPLPDPILDDVTRDDLEWI